MHSSNCNHDNLRRHGDEEVWVKGAADIGQSLHTKPYLVTIRSYYTNGAEQLYNQWRSPATHEDYHNNYQ